jgi:hypothetical protein
MGWLNWRVATVAAFMLVSAGVWLLLEGFELRLLSSAIPLLFAAQILLSDALEGFLISKVGFRTRLFTWLIAPGTILHELCHLFAALATGCKVTEAALFRPNPRTGVLGFVNYVQPKDKWVVLREFIVGFAPFFGCGLALLTVNMLWGGGLLSLIVGGLPQDAGEFADLAGKTVASAVETAVGMDYSKPLIIFIAYLQMCFAVGAAPSTTDFKGALSSLWQHLFSSAVFAAILSLIIMASQQMLPLGDYSGWAASAVGAVFQFTAITLILSLSLTAVLLPMAYAASKLAEIGGVASTIPVTSAFLAYFALFARSPEWALPSSAAVFILSALILSAGGKK